MVKQKQAIKLYDDQLECIRKFKAVERKGNLRILLVAICGSGKTVIAGSLIKQKIASGCRCLFLVPMTCLLKQTKFEFAKLGIKSTIVQSNRKYDRKAGCVIASLDTLAQRLKSRSIEELLGDNIKFVVVDEAHYSSYKRVTEKIQSHFVSTSATILGLTATPWRLNPNEYLGEYFDTIIEAGQAPDLIKLGRAVPCRIFGFDQTFDISQLDIGADGEYLESQMAHQAMQRASMNCVLREYINLASDRQAISFCVNIAHAKALCELFRQNGVSGDCVFGETPESERQVKFARLKSGMINVLFSVNALNIGFNLSNISCVIFARITNSKAFWFQSIGRGARTHPGKYDYIVLDFGNNAARLGNPNDYHKYDISPKPYQKGDAKLKECPECEALVSSFSKICSECGYAFTNPEDEPEEIDERDSGLVELLLGFDKTKAKFLRHHKRACFIQRVTPDLAVEVFLKTYGHIPPEFWHRHAILGINPTTKARFKFISYLETLAYSEYKLQWLDYQMRLEFG